MNQPNDSYETISSALLAAFKEIQKGSPSPIRITPDHAEIISRHLEPVTTLPPASIKIAVAQGLNDIGPALYHKNSFAALGDALRIIRHVNTALAVQLYYLEGVRA